MITQSAGVISARSVARAGLGVLADALGGCTVALSISSADGIYVGRSFEAASGPEDALYGFLLALELGIQGDGVAAMLEGAILGDCPQLAIQYIRVHFPWEQLRTVRFTWVFVGTTAFPSTEQPCHPGQPIDFTNVRWVR